MQACQPSTATLEPTLAGKDPKQAPRIPCPLPFPMLYVLSKSQALSQLLLFLRDKGTEEGHGTGATGLCGTFLCLCQAQVHENTGRAGSCEGSGHGHLTAAYPVQAEVLEVHSGLQTLSLSPWLHAYTSFGALPPPSRSGSHPPLETASVQLLGRANLYISVQCGTPGSNLKGWSQNRLLL